MKSIKTKIFLYIITLTVTVGGFMVFIYRKPMAQDISVDTSNWKTWSWSKACGGFDIKHAPDWHTQMGYSGDLGCNGTISHMPSKYPSLAKSDEGIVVRFSYSYSSAEAETTTQELEKEINQFPERAFFPSILRCIKSEDTERKYLFIKCYTIQDKEVYIISADVKNDVNNVYEIKVNELLNSFKINN